MRGRGPAPRRRRRAAPLPRPLGRRCGPSWSSPAPESETELPGRPGLSVREGRCPEARRPAALRGICRRPSGRARAGPRTTGRGGGTTPRRPGTSLREERAPGGNGDAGHPKPEPGSLAPAPTSSHPSRLPGSRCQFRGGACSRPAVRQRGGAEPGCGAGAWSWLAGSTASLEIYGSRHVSVMTTEK